MIFLRRLIIIAMIVYLLVPVVMTFLYSLSRNWTRLLPERITTEAWAALFLNDRFWSAMLRSLILAGSTVGLSILFLVPTLFAVTLYAPRLAGFLEFASLWPFVFPGVIYAVGLITIYSNPPLAISGTPWLLIPAVTVVVMPYAYRAVANAFAAADVRQLAEAARSLGANDLQILAWVIFPSVLPGVLSGAVLAVSAAFGEFSLVQLLVGSGWETLSFYQTIIGRQDGHISAAISSLSFLLAWLFGTLALNLRRDERTVTTP